MLSTLKTPIEGIILFKQKRFADARGEFFVTWCLNDYKSFGIMESFRQDNISYSKKNVLRGLHFQKNQGQLVWVSLGEIYYVAVDIRSYSATYKQYFAIKLNSDNPQQIYVAPGFAHGFCALSEKAIVNYKCTQYYDPKEEGGILWCDPTINIQWPITSPIINERDKNFKCI